MISWVVDVGEPDDVAELVHDDGCAPAAGPSW